VNATAGRHLQSIIVEGHSVTCYRTVGGGWQATCKCGWEGTPMTGQGAHQSSIDQYRSHLKGLTA
jgi:hypothetical protein